MLIDSKSQLAKLLATENIIVEQQKVPTAFFHVKERRLVIPILDEALSTYLYDLMCGHEVGHALYTPEQGWHDSIVDLKIPKSIVNVVEDARIEKLIKRKYPGLRASFVKAYRELMERDFFDIKGADVNKLNLIDRLNLHFKVGAHLSIRFTESERNIVREMENLESWDDVIVACNKIVTMMKEQAEEQRKQKEERGDLEEDDDGDSFAPESGFDFSDDDYDLTEDGEGDIPESSPDLSEEETEDSNSSGKAAEQSENEEELKSHTDEAFREREKELVSNDQREHVYANLPKPHLQNIIVPYKKVIQQLKTCGNNYGHIDFLCDYEGKLETNHFIEFRSKSNQVVSYLAKEFELRKNAEQMKKASVAKTGDLDMNRIHNYMFTEDIFKRVTNVPNGKSHGLVMFIDWSGSMSDCMHDTIKQLLNLVLFCRKINIPFEVYAFTNKQTDSMSASFTSEEGDIVPGSFNLLTLFSNRMSTNEMSYMANCLLKMSKADGIYTYYHKYPEFMMLNGTPLNEAIIAAMEIIPAFRDANKLQVVNTVFLTDGDGHALERIKKTYTLNGNAYTSNPQSISPWNNNIVPVIRHKKTGIVQKIVPDKNGNSNNRKHTAAYLSILKKVTNCNVVGFYLLRNREAKNFIESNVSNPTIAEYMLAEFRKSKSTVVKSEGYDEYYLMKSDTKVDEADEIVAKSNTTRGLVSAFAKYNNTRFVNRVVLNKFIGMIA